MLALAVFPRQRWNAVTYRQDQHYRTAGNGRVTKVLGRRQRSTQEAQERCDGDFEYVRI